jgi:ELWxxDGT repeat protein
MGSSEAGLVKDIFPGVASSDPHHLTVVNDVLYFGADDSVNGDELWRSNGTAEGTALIEDYALGAENSHPHGFTAFAGTVFFIAWRPEDGMELRALKGGKITCVRDIAPDTASSHPDELVVLGNHLYFLANDGIHGKELWVTEGDEKNTRMVYDLLQKAKAGAYPGGLTPAESALFFAANDGVYGTELWYMKPNEHKARLVRDVALPQTLMQPKTTAMPREKVTK